jgi:site-specific DNA-adenine methylase
LLQYHGSGKYQMIMILSRLLPTAPISLIKPFFSGGNTPRWLEKALRQFEAAVAQCRPTF